MKKSPLASRKFWVAISTFACVMLSEICGVDIDPANLAAVVLPIVAWLIGESLIDAKK